MARINDINKVVLALALACLLADHQVASCRVGSERLKRYAVGNIQRMLDADNLASVYWSDEPLDARALSKATGINIILAETQFNLGRPATNQTGGKGDGNAALKGDLIRDIFVACSADRDRKFKLTINLELDNPFKVIQLKFNRPANLNKANTQVDEQVMSTSASQETVSVSIHMPQSSLLVQMNQRISYDECLNVNYIQLAPNVDYNIDCAGCDKELKDYLDNMLRKRMTQLDAELDSMLSEKLMLGLQVLLNQQRLDLDLYSS